MWETLPTCRAARSRGIAARGRTGRRENLEGRCTFPCPPTYPSPGRRTPSLALLSCPTKGRRRRSRLRPERAAHIRRTADATAPTLARTSKTSSGKRLLRATPAQSNAMLRSTLRPEQRLLKGARLARRGRIGLTKGLSTFRSSENGCRPPFSPK